MCNPKVCNSEIQISHEKRDFAQGKRFLKKIYVSNAGVLLCAYALLLENTSQNQKSACNDILTDSICPDLRSRRPATRVSRALRARVSRGVSPRVSQQGVSEGVSPGVPGCPQSVSRVSGHLFDTPETSSGHFLDTPEPGARRGPGTPQETVRRTPPFSGTLSEALPGTLRLSCTCVRGPPVALHVSQVLLRISGFCRYSSSIALHPP